MPLTTYTTGPGELGDFEDSIRVGQVVGGSNNRESGDVEL